MKELLNSMIVLLLLIAALTQVEKSVGSSCRAYPLLVSQSLTDYLQQARFHLRQGNYSAAREAALKALGQEPKSAEAEYLIGASDLALGEWGKAQLHFGKSLEFEPLYPDAHRGIGAIYLKQKRYAEAAGEFSKVLTIKPDDFIALYSLGLSYLLQDRLPPALEQFDLAYRINPKEAGLLMAILQANIKLKQRPQAEKTLGELSALLDARDPRRLQTAFLLGNEGFYDLAIREYEALREVYPESAQLSFNLALAYHRLRRDSEAARILEAALAGHEEASLYNLYGEIQEARRLPVQAVAAYRRASDLEPQHEDYLFDYAQSLVGAGTLDEALRVFTKATEVFPASSRMWLGLGAAQYVKGDYRQAVEIFLRVAQKAPGQPEVFELLGRAYDAAGTQQATIERIFSEYLRSQTNDARAEFFYGKILAARSRQENASASFDQAQHHLERALSLVENFPEAHLELGNIFFVKNQLDAARRHLERAAELAPTNPDIFYRLSRLYARTNERTRSQDALRKFQQLKAEQQQGADQNRNEMMKYLNSEGH